ncbi:hypothetical protein Ccar_06725 [Clostridium carboxidivorans P7]|uniref:Uncharacterized protein n=1 Tax=Clostridium carboxidivorans P7 TaxID=536227 RepID=C6PWD4_9CLOT|nr:hypothetical protein [Clostridium carboxidivorans]AKN30534.1 hypothetical protein Ccar_06725 [Clostridium carboxidivorans P7]EET86411.1 hypothetical protein CcarbDRAFT_3101 [Clostridium carboxidivorans P7]EFG86279.1 hypothetical protein CLCAR_4104 [Clostridium carboxidivorans P7]
MDKYNIPLGTLVEVNHIDLEADKKNHGVRLYVVAHHKDAKGTPIYSLGLKGETNALKMYNGYYEENLKVIDKISVELTKDEINDIVQWGDTCEEEGWLIDKEVKLKDRLSKII